MSRFRNVCFTSFGDEPTFSPGMSYLVYGLESCPDTGRWHWQGYAEFARQVSRRQLKEILGDSHFEPRFGTAEQAATYCCKGGQYCEHGQISRQGHRSDLGAISQSIVDGSSLQSVAISQPALFVQYGRGLSLLASISQGLRRRAWREVVVTIIFGVTGAGKTRSFYSQYPLNDTYVFNYSNAFWDGYSGQKHILFDEFESQILLSNMLQYTDGHPILLDVKFGHAHADWDTVTIISNSNPQTFYHNVPAHRRNAFARRIYQVIEYVNSDTRIVDFSFKFDYTIQHITADSNI